MEYKENIVLKEEIVKKIRKKLYMLESMNNHRSVPKKNSEMSSLFRNEIHRIVKEGHDL